MMKLAAGSLSVMRAALVTLLTLAYSAIVVSGSFVWFDAPSEYSFLMYASGKSLGACVSKCSSTPSCVWTAFEDGYGRCELRTASRNASADLLPTSVLVRSTNDDAVPNDFVLKNGTSSSAAVFSTAAEWCTIEKTTSIRDILKCKGLCESNSECGRVSFDVTKGACETQKPCGDNSSLKARGVIRLPAQTIKGQNTGMSVASYVDIPSGYMCVARPEMKCMDP